ncbi:MAG: cytochrome c oxidase accessory protein CcoG [Rubripirellula sp.]|jgi:cytochrome c oxidase accessory protein FixG|nr:cytochrome c oxidase accessory protein CcoG [Rubripirellula sp.]
MMQPNDETANTTEPPDHAEQLLDAPEQVLSTLKADGSRRWLYPRLSKGKLWYRRRLLAYFLIVFFVALPHLRWSGKPLILLDITSRKFVFFGHTFLPTDTLLLTLLMLGVFLTIVLATAMVGRVWCGWACPQTVYMEFLFRPIDRLFQGTAGKGGKPKQKITGWRAVARFMIYLVLCGLLAHTFLAYFVGTEQLAQWVRRSPLEHPTSFLVMGATTGLMLFDFLFFREQLCLIACPYGRFQSVMLDRQSLIVAYDANRGEPRRKGKRSEADAAGDCVDCNQCVVVCPTGIDIRNGLQLECVNCTQCIDACNNVMDRVGKPRGLVRYSSQDALGGKQHRMLRLRTVAYPMLLVAVAVAFLIVLTTKFAFDAQIARGRGNPFQQISPGVITNNFSLRLTNRTDEPREYTIAISEPSGATLLGMGDEPLRVEGNDEQRIPIVVEITATEIGSDGRENGVLRILDDIGNQRELKMSIMGPRL